MRARPTGLRGFARGKITPRKALFHEKLEGVENLARIYEHAEEHRTQFNLYIAGSEGEETPPDLPSEPAKAEATAGEGARGETAGEGSASQ